MITLDTHHTVCTFPSYFDLLCVALVVWTSILNIWKELPWVNRTNDPVEDQKGQLLSFQQFYLNFAVSFSNPTFYWISFIIKRKFRVHVVIMRFFIIPHAKWKVFNIVAPPTPSRYSYSQLARLYIHKRSWHDTWGPVSGGGMSYTTFGNLERGNEGDTELKCFTFDVFTLSININ